MRKKNGNKNTSSATNMEQIVSYESLAKKKIKRFSSLCNIHIHSVRKRLADADGISGKAIIDGLVHAGILEDDSSKFVKEVRFSQEKGFPEETTITLTKA